ncbi:hypothetical protein LA080_012504 [Diaporthe eres]|nr:hypothetical protein LA080_012504 [Diaporthe eres]
MSSADWTARDREIIELRYRQWKMTDKPFSRRRVVTAVAMRCGDMTGDPETWFAHQWAQQIGSGRPQAQTKTSEQIALLNYAFRETCGYPYTGEVLPLAFLSGLQVEQVKTWFENQRRKYTDEGDSLAVSPPEIFGMQGQDTKNAATMTRQYNKDPEGYARSLCPRPYFKKYWARMFPEDGDERSLLEITEDLEDSEEDSFAKLTTEEMDDMMTQTQIENRQYKRNQEELEAEALMQENEQ